MNDITYDSVMSCKDSNETISDVTKVTPSEVEHTAEDEDFNIVICDVRSLSEATDNLSDPTPPECSSDLPHTLSKNVEIDDHSYTSKVVEKASESVPETNISQALPQISSDDSTITVTSCKSSAVSLSSSLSETVNSFASLNDTTSVVTSSGLSHLESESLLQSDKSIKATCGENVPLTSLNSTVSSPSTNQSSLMVSTTEPFLTNSSDVAVTAVSSGSTDSNTSSTLHPVTTSIVSLSSSASNSNKVSESVSTSCVSSTLTTAVSDAIVCSSVVSLSTSSSSSDASQVVKPSDSSVSQSPSLLTNPPVLTVVQNSKSPVLASDSNIAVVNSLTSTLPISSMSVISSSVSATSNVPMSIASLPLSSSIPSISNAVDKLPNVSSVSPSISLAGSATFSSSPSISSSSIVTSLTNVSVSNAKGTPSSSSEAAKFFPPADVVVKTEPVDDYCQVTPSTSQSENLLKPDCKPAFLHKGNKLNAFAPLSTSNPQKIMLAKVNVSKTAVGSQSAQLFVNKNITSKPLLITDNSVKLNHTPLVNASKPASVLTSDPMPLALMTSSSIKKNKTSDELSHLETINIHSVGVPRITDLIARKNPIPVYKPPPLPSDIKFDEEMELHTCHECGDSFRLASSLNVHINRCVMHIRYKCLHCGIVLFSNKCQLLSHLRSHLNIEKSQAVPIHIMSDSIEITSSFKDIVPGKPFEWYKTPFKVMTSPTKTSNGNFGSISTGTCRQCNSVFPDKKSLICHIQGTNQTRFFCSECPMCLNSACAMAAHSAFHKLVNMSYMFGEISTEMKELVKSLQCPECGLKFWEHASKNTSLSKYIYDAILHMKLECFHLSRLAGFECSKCDTMFSSTKALENHLLGKVEHYFKCELCPMALKAVKGIHTHFMFKHKNVDSGDVKAKVIYRCHICDTLIDDKTFLLQHVASHVRVHKVNSAMHYHCLFCGEMFPKIEPLRKHTKEKHTQIKRQFTCACKKQYGSPLKYMKHVFSLSCVSVVKSNVETFFCDRCNIACVGQEALNVHTCLAVKLANVAFEVDEKGEKLDTKPEIKPATVYRKIAKKPGDCFEANLPPGVKKYCVWCKEEFRSAMHRENHLKNHITKDNWMTCIHCDYIGAKTKNELTSHEISCLAILKMKSRKRKEIEDEVQITSKKVCKKSETKVVEQFLCEKCDSIFSRKNQLEEHEKSEHGIHPCHLCGSVYDSLRGLNKHLSAKHAGKRALFICRVCKVFTGTKMEAIVRHIKQKHRVKSSIVPDCIITCSEKSDEGNSSESNDVKRSTSAETENPIKKLKVEGEDIFKCAKCQYMSSSKEDFREHILSHKTSETYQCLECGLCFAAFPSLKRHVIIVHKIKSFDKYMEENKIEEPTVSSVLEETVPLPSALEPDPSYSDESEDDLNNLECKVCYKKFEAIESLQYHVRVHGMAFIRRKSRFKLKKKTKKSNEIKKETS